MTYVPNPGSPPQGQPADPNAAGAYPFAPSPPPYTEYPQPGPGFGVPGSVYGAEPYGAGPYGAGPYGAGPYGAGGYGYPPPGYGYPPPPGYGYPRPGSGRPGTVIASSVLAHILAGLLIIAGIVLLSLASSTSQVYDSLYVDGGNLTAELTFDGFLDFVAAGLLIGGAVGFTTGRRTGRTVLIAGNAITLCAAIYWLIRTSGNTGAVVWILLFSALAVVGLGLAFSAPINAWLTRRSAAAAQPGPYPR